MRRATMVCLPLLFPVLLGCGGQATPSGAPPTPTSTANWQPVARPDLGFQAMMPATPRIVQDTQDAGRGMVVRNKFVAEPEGKEEVYAITSVRFLSMRNTRLKGGPEKLLELGKKDLLKTCKGEIKSEKRISLGRNSGFELEILPAKGPVFQARIYARLNQVFEVYAQVPESPSASRKVRKFFDSFKLSDELTEDERLLKQMENDPLPEPRKR